MTIHTFRAELNSVFPGVIFDVEEDKWGGFSARTPAARVSVERGLSGGLLYSVACSAISEGCAAATGLTMAEAACKFRLVVHEANQSLASLETP